MSKLLKKRGVILFVVIALIIIVGILSVVILRVISSQARLTHHQLSRIQAMYAAKAGVIYAMDALRRNAAGWTSNSAFSKSMCRASCDVNEPNLPNTIQSITINVGNSTSGVVPGTRRVSATVDYTYP